MATLTFSVEQDQVQAGQVLAGNLNIKATRMIQCDKIELYFRGKEYTRVTKGHGQHKKICTGKVPIVYLDLLDNNTNRSTQRIVQQPGGCIYPGTYTVPFQVTLPTNLPSSMTASVGGRRQGSARIEYCLRAVLKGTGALFGACQTRRQVKVVAKPSVPQETAPMVIPPVTQNICHLGLFDQGSISLGAKVLDTKLVPGQSVGVVLSIVNDSGATLKAVNVALQQICHFSAPRHSVLGSLLDAEGNAANVVTTTIVSKTWLMENTNQYQPLDKQALQELKTHSQTTRCNENHYRIMQQLNDKCNHNYKTRALMLPPIPQHATENFAGKRIQVSYRLVVQVQTKGIFTNPELALGVTVSPQDRLEEKHGIPGAPQAAGESASCLAKEAPMAVEVVPIHA